MPTYDTYLPITLPFKDKSSDGLPAEVLTGRFIKLSALLRQFQSTHFATENCRQVCCCAMNVAH